MSNFLKEYINPKDVFSGLGIKVPEYITINPDLSKKNGATIEIIRQNGHDGAASFEWELLVDTIKNVANRVTYDTRIPIDGAIDIRYEIGLIRRVTVFGLVTLGNGRKYPGEKQRTRMPVKCIIKYKTAEQ